MLDTDTTKSVFVMLSDDVPWLRYGKAVKKTDMAVKPPCVIPINVFSGHRFFFYTGDFMKKVPSATCALCALGIDSLH